MGKLRNAKIFEKIVPFVNLTIVAYGGIYLLSFEKKIEKDQKENPVLVFTISILGDCLLSSLSVIDLEYRVIDETRFARLKNESRKDGMLIICPDGIFFFPRECGDVDVTRKKKSRFSASCEAEEYCYFIIVYGGGKGVGYLYIYFS